MISGGSQLTAAASRGSRLDRSSASAQERTELGEERSGALELREVRAAREHGERAVLNALGNGDAARSYELEVELAHDHVNPHSCG